MVLDVSGLDGVFLGFFEMIGGPEAGRLARKIAMQLCQIRI